jgi:hypothetical protein
MQKLILSEDKLEVRRGKCVEGSVGTIRNEWWVCGRSLDVQFTSNFINHK